MTFVSDNGYTYVRYCSLFIYTFSVKPRGCNVFSFSLRYCLVIMCCYCESSNDVKKFVDMCIRGIYKNDWTKYIRKSLYKQLYLIKDPTENKFIQQKNWVTRILSNCV